MPQEMLTQNCHCLREGGMCFLQLFRGCMLFFFPLFWLKLEGAPIKFSSYISDKE